LVATDDEYEFPNPQRLWRAKSFLPQSRESFEWNPRTEKGRKEIMIQPPHISGPLINQPETGKLITARIGPGIPIWALLLRAIPLTVSFVLFVLAASAEVNKWGSKGVQAMLLSATLLGIFGIFLFVPGRDMPTR
jgi:hypothetical protein